MTAQAMPIPQRLVLLGSSTPAHKTGVRVDGHLVSGIGSILGGAAAFIMAILAVAKRHRAAAWFMSRSTLITRAQEAEGIASFATERADSAESARDNWQSNFDAVTIQQAKDRARIDRLEAVAQNMEVLRLKFDAMVDYTERVVEYAAYLEAQLRVANIGFDRKMPPVPAILADKFGIPEQLQGGLSS